MNESIQQLLRGLTAVVRRMYYYGHSYVCPFCRSRLRLFLPFGDDQPVLKKMNVLSAGRRLNAQCPVCGSLDRDRLLYLYLLHKTSVFRDHVKLLHIAPERPLQRILRRQSHLEYITADLSRDDVMVKADLNNLPFASDEFDAVICNHVLEYIADDHKAMGEIHRVMRPGGWAILMEQIALSLETTYEDARILTRSERQAAYGEPGHMRLYGNDYHTRIEQAGFRVEAFQYSIEDGSFGGPRNTYGLLQGERVFVAFKPGQAPVHPVQKR